MAIVAESAEELIPDHKSVPEVRIIVLGIDGMMDSVRLRSGDQVGKTTEVQPNVRVAQDVDRQENDPEGRDQVGPESENGDQVKRLVEQQLQEVLLINRCPIQISRRMVDLVNMPQAWDLMHATVRPVARECNDQDADEHVKRQRQTPIQMCGRELEVDPGISE